MNKDTVFGKTGRCLGRLVGAYVFRKTGTDRAFYWRKGLRDEEGGMWQLLQQVVGVHMVIWHVRMVVGSGHQYGHNLGTSRFSRGSNVTT